MFNIIEATIYVMSLLLYVSLIFIIVLMKLINDIFYIIVKLFTSIKVNNVSNDVYILIIIILIIITSSYFLLFKKSKIQKTIIETNDTVLNDTVSNDDTESNDTENVLLIDLTEDDKTISTEISNDSSKKELITDDEYNQLLFDSIVHIWKKYGNNKWYYKSNEDDVKYIISQLLPKELKNTNDLFMEYKGKFINTISDDIVDELIRARELRPSIYHLINEIYKKIKNSYKDGVDNNIINF